MINQYLIPIIVFVILLNAFIKKLPIFNIFIEGCNDGMKIIIDIIPSIIALIFAVNIFHSSGFIQLFGNELLPMMIMRPISGNACLAMLNKIYEIYGVDSFLGNLASVIQGSTDTTIYVLALYFGSVHIQKTRYALWVGLFADFIGILSAVIVCHFFF